MSASMTKPDPRWVRKRAGEHDSQSNGSLMRITPLAVYLANLEDDATFAHAVRSEVSLTHSNRTAQDAAVCYCLAIKVLINSLGDREAAYARAKYHAVCDIG